MSAAKPVGDRFDTHSSILDHILGLFRSDDNLLLLAILVIEADREDMESLSV